MKKIKGRIIKKNLSLRLNPTEERFFKELAKELQLTLSALVRALLFWCRREVRKSGAEKVRKKLFEGSG